VLPPSCPLDRRRPPPGRKGPYMPFCVVRGCGSILLLVLSVDFLIIFNIHQPRLTVYHMFVSLAFGAFS